VRGRWEREGEQRDCSRFTREREREREREGRSAGRKGEEERGARGQRRIMVRRVRKPGWMLDDPDSAGASVTCAVTRGVSARVYLILSVILEIRLRRSAGEREREENVYSRSVESREAASYREYLITSLYRLASRDDQLARGSSRRLPRTQD